MRSGILAALASCLLVVPLRAVEWEKTQLAATVTPTGMEATFRVTNKSAAPVTILSVTPDCNCTTTELSRTILAPGETVELRARARLDGRPGYVEKKLSVLTDDEGGVPAILTFGAQIPETVFLEPGSLTWAAGDRTARTLTLTSPGPASLVKLDCDQALFAAEKIFREGKVGVQVRPVSAGPVEGGLEVVVRTATGRVLHLRAALRVLPAPAEVAPAK